LVRRATTLTPHEPMPKLCTSESLSLVDGRETLPMPFAAQLPHKRRRPKSTTTLVSDAKRGKGWAQRVQYLHSYRISYLQRDVSTQSEGLQTKETQHSSYTNANHHALHIRLRQYLSTVIKTDIGSCLADGMLPVSDPDPHQPSPTLTDSYLVMKLR